MSLQYSPLFKPSTPPKTEAWLGVGTMAVPTHSFPENTYEIIEPTSDESRTRKWHHLYVLPVILLEFLALALTRAVIPSLLLQEYGDKVYLVMGFADFCRGSLAFVACPLFGKISDIIGRKVCLLVTVIGTCSPVCCLAFFKWDEMESVAAMSFFHRQLDSEASSLHNLSLPTNSEAILLNQQTHSLAITVFIILLSLSGIFSSTFTLVFAYISDTARHQEERVSAYGLALATFGLSFTIGPMAGGYLATYNRQYVFITSLILTIIDVAYIYLVLPESRVFDSGEASSSSSAKSSHLSLLTREHKIDWNPIETLRIVILDPFLRKVGEVAFLYYTGLWAIISTLSVYAVKRFHLTPERLGELMSAIGLCTMMAEAVLVRIVVPLLGEKRSIRIGLASFCLQCILLGFAYKGWHLFVCMAFSLAGNLVYPSLSSLASASVEPDAVGEALGAINGIKALTEGIGPLVFGSLMTISEHTVLPGWPYLLASLLILIAYRASGDLPDPDLDDYVHELDRKGRYHGGLSSGTGVQMQTRYREEEYEDLLSDIDESETSVDDSFDFANRDDEDTLRLPSTSTFLSLLPKALVGRGR